MDPNTRQIPGATPPGQKPPPLWLVRLISGLMVAAIVVIAVFLGGVILITGAILAVGLWGWLWWQRRKMMKMMDEQGGMDPLQQAQAAFAQRARAAQGRAGRSSGKDDRIIEGDFTVVEDDAPDTGPRRDSEKR